MDTETSEIQQVIYVHRFTGCVSAYFYLCTFIYKNDQFGCYSRILLQYNLDFCHISQVTLISVWGWEGGSVHEKCVKAVSFLMTVLIILQGECIKK